ncbi:hypothetical protein SISNIDRAFT_526883 [Sistotremastrum niveocremeum HHB9708]|uniref:Uncharacterized protein n=1 Tax=Sistotremastrum niveocremeum HHB9708 TaxID=1314777 RepID=A0A164QC24_9AGAM|nr:hypothetical protein SISNIDRAFT_526883 [Sistotremastrum niveocremeum HHB9708]
MAPQDTNPLTPPEGHPSLPRKVTGYAVTTDFLLNYYKPKVSEDPDQNFEELLQLQVATSASVTDMAKKTGLRVLMLDGGVRGVSTRYGEKIKDSEAHVETNRSSGRHSSVWTFGGDGEDNPDESSDEE